jgi:hypothetical protein
LLDEGFVDSYREVNPDNPGFTFGVTDNEFTDAENSTLVRIDYIFVKGTNIRIDSSQLVFDVDGEYVSEPLRRPYGNHGHAVAFHFVVVGQLPVGFRRFGLPAAAEMIAAHPSLNLPS